MNRRDNNPRPPTAGESSVADRRARTSQPRLPRPLSASSIPTSSRKEAALLLSTPASPGLRDPRVGETIVGRYRLDGLIGKGGMGRVYRATQMPLNRPVAIKILNPEFQRKDPQFVRRFFLEAATAARLTHPNTITVFDYGESDNGELFIAMEFLQGRPLSRVIATDGRFATVRTLHVATQICRALREAHSKGMIHRDLKPGNIVLTEENDDRDFVKVVDFGLVKLFNATQIPSVGPEPLSSEPDIGDLTRAGMFLGSPKYMSPEQIQGIALDPRTDIYSLGVLMYQMATGRPPFNGATSVEVIYKHVNDAPPPLTAGGIDVPPELQAIILRCLSKRREERYPSMGALLVHLKDARHLLVPRATEGESEADIDLSDLTSSMLTHQRAGAESLVSGSMVSGSLTGLNPPLSQMNLNEPLGPVSRSPTTPEIAFADGRIIGDDTGVGIRFDVAPSWGERLVGIIVPGLVAVVVAALCAYGWLVVFVWKAPTAVDDPPPSAAASTMIVRREGAASPTKSTAAVGRSAQAVVAIDSVPPGAEVFEAGVPIGRTPLTHRTRYTASDEPVELIFRLEGYEPAVQRVQIDRSEINVTVTLSAASEATIEPVPSPESDDAPLNKP